MEKLEAIEKIHYELTTGMQLAKCQQCGCMRGALDSFSAQIPQIANEDVSIIAGELPAWSAAMKDIRYACLGCEHCYPAVAENAFAQAFPDLNLPTALGCDFQFSQAAWPAVIGEYFVLEKTGSVAISTLGSVQLAETLAEMDIKGVAIVGKTETENIGIDKIVRNIISNSSIKFLVIAGQEPRGHLSGDALIALSENGVDEKSRVVGASGKRPVLRNVEFKEIEEFRNQVQVIDMRGCEEATVISEKVNELVNEISTPCCGEEQGGGTTNYGLQATLELMQSSTDEAGCADPNCACHSQNKDQSQPEAVESECADPQCACHTQTSALPSTIIASEFDQNIPLDKSGYLVILPVADRNVINVEHYSYDNTLLHVMEGSNSRGLYLSIIREGWVSDLNHAAYLGKELSKAELSLKHGFKYTQDGA